MLHASGSLPYWFDGLPSFNGLRNSACVLAFTVVLPMPKMPPKKLLTLCAIVTLYW